MAYLHQKSYSVWQDENLPTFEALEHNLSTDVCIVGAGLTGLSTAYHLLKKGFKVVVIDKDSFGRNESGLTSAHLTYALDARYYELIKKFGRNNAQLIYQSHAQAINRIEEIVNAENIGCDFSRLPGYLFAAENDDKKEIEREYEAAAHLGIPGVELLNRVPARFMKTKPCLMFPNQAQFHSLKYLKGLAQAVEKMGGRIYIHTAADKIQGGQEAYVSVQSGFKIDARHIVVATHVPVNDRLEIHIKEAAYRSYVLGVKLPRGIFDKVLLWDTADPYHFVRIVDSPEHPGYDVLLVGGEDHRTGQDQDIEHKYLNLKKWTREQFNLDPQIIYSWSGQIIETPDGLAYIGHNPSDYDNVLIATGFSGNGTTYATISGILLTDMIAQRKNEWEKIYSPHRLTLRGLPAFLDEAIISTSGYGHWVLPGDVKNVSELARGQGAIVRQGMKKIAAYRDLHGRLHQCSAVCPHLSGVVQWNTSEQTWDCPCHGSRFNAYGEVINGPANSGLSPVQEQDQIEPTL